MKASKMNKTTTTTQIMSQAKVKKEMKKQHVVKILQH